MCLMLLETSLRCVFAMQNPLDAAIRPSSEASSSRALAFAHHTFVVVGFTRSSQLLTGAPASPVRGADRLNVYCGTYC